MRKSLLIITLMGILSYSIGQHKEIILPKYLSNNAEKYLTYPIEPISDKSSQGLTFKDIKDDAVGQTWYDLLTYNSLQHRMYTWPDGTTGVTWMMAFQSGSWSDLGTGYNYYNGNNWGILPNEGLENEPSSGTNYFSFGENGEIIVSYFLGDDWKLSFYKRENRGEGEWENLVLEGPEPGVGLAWASMMINGSDNKTIHILCKTTGNQYMGQNSAFLYSRSQDGGTSWDIQYQYFEELSPDYLNNVGRDCYTWAYPKGDTIAFTAGFSTGHGYVMKSFDNGDNWDKISVYENPFSPYLGGATPHFGSGDGTSTVALDSDGNAHVVFSRMVFYYNDMSNLYYVPATEGLIYWNETMPMLDTTAVSSYTFDHLIEGGNLIGWVTSNSGDSTLLGWGTYYLSLTTWPQLLIDPDDRIFVIYSGVAADFDNEVMNYRHIYANSSNDKGETWNGIVDINTNFIYTYSECIFPALSPLIQDSKLHLCFQEDTEQGLFVWIGQQEYPTDNKIIYMPVDVGSIVSLKENNDENTSFISCTNFPNPFSEFCRFKIQLKKQANVILQIRDITGKLKAAYDLGLKKEGTNIFKFENQNLEAGIYFYTLITENGKCTGKMVIQ